MKNMTDFQIIDRLISENKYDEALSLLDKAIDSEVDCRDAELFFIRGKVKWKLDDRAGAITDYEHACAIDSNSPAAKALEISRDIMDFFNPDIFNP